MSPNQRAILINVIRCFDRISNSACWGVCARDFIPLAHTSRLDRLLERAADLVGDIWAIPRTPFHWRVEPRLATPHAALSGRTSPSILADWPLATLTPLSSTHPSKPTPALLLPPCFDQLLRRIHLNHDFFFKRIEARCCKSKCTGFLKKISSR